MAVSILSQSRWNGGMSSDLKEGPKNSFFYSLAFDFRKNPSQLSILPGTRVDSGEVVSDLILDMVQVNDGSRYAIGDTGTFYKRTTGGTWSKVGSISESAYGMLYRPDTDAIYLTKDKEVAIYHPVSGSPILTSTKFGPSRSEESAALKSGGTNTYSLTTAVNEASIHKREFTSDIEPLYSIKVFVKDKGTGDWTLTLHDDANNSLGSVTVTNANLFNNQLNEFKFSSQVRILVKPNARTYHYHLTSTVADGTVQTTTASSLADCDVEVWADRLVNTNNGFHPIMQFLQYTLIGNGNYVAQHEPLSDDPSNLEFKRHRLVLPTGYEVTGLSQWEEFAVIAAEKRASSSAQQFQKGLLFFWDGLSSTYNYYIDITEGSPYSPYLHNNTLYYFARDSLYGYAGGRPTKIRTMRETDAEFSDTSDSYVVYPNMMAVRRGVLLTGFPSETTNQSVEHGVYSYGSIEKNYNESFGFSYAISSGTLTNTGSNNLRIGMIRNFGDELFVSWREGSEYGVDIVDNSSDPASTAILESLTFDNEVAYKNKLALALKLTFTALPADMTVTLKYSINRAAFVTADTATEGDTLIYSEFDPSGDVHFKEIQFRIEATGTATSTPIFNSFAFEFDDLEDEDFSD